VALLKLLQDSDISVHNMIKRKIGRVKFHQSFSSEKMYSLIAIDYMPGEFNEEGIDNCVRVFVKGAPEKVIEKCDY
jgi:magnesium-transporting ATPase (P-type)